MHPAEYKRKRVRDIGGGSEMGKYFDVLRIICHTEKKEEMESHQNR